MFKNFAVEAGFSWVEIYVPENVTKYSAEFRHLFIVDEIHEV